MPPNGVKKIEQYLLTLTYSLVGIWVLSLRKWSQSSSKLFSKFTGILVFYFKSFYFTHEIQTLKSETQEQGPVAYLSATLFSPSLFL